MNRQQSTEQAAKYNWLEFLYDLFLWILSVPHYLLQICHLKTLPTDELGLNMWWRTLVVFLWKINVPSVFCNCRLAEVVEKHLWTKRHKVLSSLENWEPIVADAAIFMAEFVCPTNPLVGSWHHAYPRSSELSRLCLKSTSEPIGSVGCTTLIL